MDNLKLRQLLKDVRDGILNVDDCLNLMKSWPYEDLGFAKIDHHRSLRKGYPEVILCQRKTPKEVAEIAKSLASEGENILATKASQRIYLKVKELLPNASYFPKARLIVINPKEMERLGLVAVISAGTADISVAEEAAITAETLGSNVKRIYDVGVAGLHRLLDCKDIIFRANVIVCVAGMEGALASVVGGMVDCPVIAVPTSTGYGASFKGIAALLTMLNSCSPGVSVMNIDNGFGAGYLANIINKRCREEK